MKTQQQFIKEYKDYFKVHGDNYLSEELDEHALETFFEDNPKAFRAMTYFQMGPEDLAKIIESIGGGDQVYEFPDMKVLRAMVLIFPFVNQTEEPFEALIDIQTFDTVIKNLFSHEELKLIPDMDMRQFHQHDGTYAISLDRAIGHIIHMEQYLWLHSQLIWGPTGDDSYFDYYPGNIDYFNSLNNWFISSDIRMT